MDLSKFSDDIPEQKIEEIKDKNLNFDTKDLQDIKHEEMERYLPWFLKYQLNSYEDLIETKEIKKIADFIENFKKGKGILLAGAPGSGKTTTLNLIGEHFDYEVLEMNASDTRNKKSIEESVGIAVKQRSLFGKNKLILIDEVDGVSGRDDRGGVAQLSNIVKESNYPIAFTANDKESDKIKALKKVCTYIDFENHNHELLVGIAKRIFKVEKIKFEEKDLLEFIEERSSKDIRGFINDLQACVYDSKFDINTELEIRDYKKKIEGLLNAIYYSYPEDSMRSNYNTDINLDELFLYLEENTPNTYSKAALINAFNEISKADVFKGRIMRWQHWRFLVYINFYLTYGISNAKDQPESIKSFKRNNRILMKWIYGNKVNALGPRTKAQKEKGDDVKFIEKLGKAYGRSAKRTRSEDLFYFSYIYQNNEEFQREMDKKFEIGESERKALNEL